MIHQEIAKPDTTVIPLFNNSLHQEDFEENTTSEVKTQISIKSLNLCSRNPHLLPKIALETHEASGRWAYLRFSDIAKNLHSAQELLEMGEVSIFVEDVLQLTPTQREILIEFINHKQTEKMPMILFGTTSKATELFEQGMIDARMLCILENHLVDADRLPTKSAQLKEALEMLLKPAQSFML